MTTITIDRELLEQALEALDNIPHPPWRDKELADAIRAELAKPSATPAWHDAPTEPGWWVRNSYEGIGVYSISEPSIKFLKGSAARWYGPIPQDTKAEGEST